MITTHLIPFFFCPKGFRYGHGSSEHDAKMHQDAFQKRTKKRRKEASEAALMLVLLDESTDFISV